MSRRTLLIIAAVIVAYLWLVHARWKTLPNDAPQTEPTALCNDGTYSYSQTDRGTCSHHGGVDQWYPDDHEPIDDGY